MTYSYSGGMPDDEKRPVAQQPVREGGKAIAEGHLIMNSAAFQAFMTACSSAGSDPWMQARLAGIVAAKHADEMLLLSLTINISGVDFDYNVIEDERRVSVRCEVRTKERIGAESCALVGCGVTLMCLANTMSAIDRNLIVEGLRILREGA